MAVPQEDIPNERKPACIEHSVTAAAAAAAVFGDHGGPLVLHARALLAFMPSTRYCLPLIAMAPRSVADRADRLPMKAPTGVLTADMMHTSVSMEKRIDRLADRGGKICPRPPRQQIPHCVSRLRNSSSIEANRTVSIPACTAPVGSCTARSRNCIAFPKAAIPEALIPRCGQGYLSPAAFFCITYLSPT